MVASLGWPELPGSWNLAIFIPADVACQVCPAADKVPWLTAVGDQGGGAGWGLPASGSLGGLKSPAATFLSNSYPAFQIQLGAPSGNKGRCQSL